MKYEVGDRLHVRRNGWCDGTGTVRGFFRLDKPDPRYCFEFDDKKFAGHDCGGENSTVTLASKNGLYIREDEVVKYLGKEEKEEIKVENKCKFNAGDKVMFLSIDEMISRYKLSSDGKCIIGPDGVNARIDYRKHLCGRIATIKEIQDDEYIHLKDWSDRSGDLSWSYFDWMFCLVEKFKVPEKKKLTVAEVEKLLGYGVEVVREGK